MSDTRLGCLQGSGFTDFTLTLLHSFTLRQHYMPHHTTPHHTTPHHTRRRLQHRRDAHAVQIDPERTGRKWRGCSNSTCRPSRHPPLLGVFLLPAKGFAATRTHMLPMHMVCAAQDDQTWPNPVHASAQTLTHAHAIVHAPCQVYFPQSKVPTDPQHPYEQVHVSSSPENTCWQCLYIGNINIIVRLTFLAR